MKRPKIDLSKDGIKRFFLHHIEKLILAAALVGFGVFFWLGFNTENYSKTDPQKLSQKADSARTYMMNDASWTTINEMRVTRDKADGIVKNTKKLDLDGYNFAKPFLGTPRQSLVLRNDPEIALINPEETITDVIAAPAFFKRKLIGRADRPGSELDKLEPSRARNAGAGRPGEDGGQTGRGSKNRDDDLPTVGDVYSDLNLLVGLGLRPGRAATNSANDVSLIKNIVSVRALIKHKEFWESCKKKLKNTYGYFPERDRPNYKLVEIQRKEGDGEWQDRTIYQNRIESVYAGLAPEVVDPDNYDPALTGRIPSIPIFDYRDFASHPTVGLRDFDKIWTIETEEETEVVNTNNPKPDRDPSDPFSDPEADAAEEDARNRDRNRGPVVSGPPRIGSDRTAYKDLDVDEPSGDLKVVRFFDLWDVKPGATYTYRFRIWADDPNHEGEKKRAQAGGGRGPGGRGDRDEGGIGQLGGGGGGGAAGLTDGGGRGGDPGGRGNPGAGRGGDPRGNPGGGRGGDPRGGRGGGDQPIVYKKIPIPDAQKDISVRDRIDDHLAQIRNNPDFQKFIDSVLKTFDVDLTYCWSSDWVEVKVTVPDSGKSDAFVGSVVAKQSKSSRRETVTVSDHTAEILVSEWSQKFGTLVAKFRQVRKGDWLNFTVDSPFNVLQIVDRRMKKMEDYSFQTDQMVVDLMGGEKIEVGRISPVEYRTPGEMLLMDDQGNVLIRNEFDQKREYLSRSQGVDETSEYNANRRRPTAPRGGRGGDGRGGDPDDIFD